MADIPLDPTTLELVGMESSEDAIEALVFETTADADDTQERVRFEGEMRVVDRFD